MDVLRYKNSKIADLLYFHNDISHSCRARIFFTYNIACNIWQHDKYFAAAVVGLERTFYQVSEGVGVVEVCAIVYSPSGACPITFPLMLPYQQVTMLLQIEQVMSSGIYHHYNHIYYTL